MTIYPFYRKQYSSFRVAPAVSVDGNVTLGENIADQGGLRIAEIAYEKWLQGHAETAHSLPALEFTHRQLFYLGYALPWCATHTDAMMRYEIIMLHTRLSCYLEKRFYHGAVDTCHTAQSHMARDQ